MRNNNSNFSCAECSRVASFDVSVPWTSRDGRKGSSWVSYCRRCYPTAEGWDVRTRKGQRTLRNARYLQAVAGRMETRAVAMLEARD